MGQNFQTTSHLKVHIGFTPKKSMHTPRKGLYQICSKNCEISNFGFLPFFFFFVFVNMGPNGGKSCKRISSERTQQIWSPKFMYIPREGLYQSRGSSK